jgi:hypothetical protein
VDGWIERPEESKLSEYRVRKERRHMWFRSHLTVRKRPCRAEVIALKHHLMTFLAL